MKIYICNDKTGDYLIGETNSYIVAEEIIREYMQKKCGYRPSINAFQDAEGNICYSIRKKDFYFKLTEIEKEGI